MTDRARPATKPAKLPREEDPRNPVQRLAAFFDEGTLELITPEDDSGMLAAVGTVDGTPVVAFCSDATIMGGAMGVAGCRVVVDAYERALADGVPIVGIWHSGGARLAEGVLSLHAVGQVFQVMTRASGKIPQISVVIGAAAGGAAYGPALTDVVILGPEGRIFVTGPDAVRSVTGEDVDTLRLGGPEPHGQQYATVAAAAAAVDVLLRSSAPAGEGAVDLAVGGAALHVLALVVQLLALDERHLDLDQVALEVEREGHDRHPLLAHALVPGAELAAVQEELALARRRVVVDVPVAVLGDGRAHEVELAPAHHAVGLGDRARALARHMLNS